MSLPRRRYAVVDVETTGLGSGADRIIDLAIVMLEHPAVDVIETFTTMVRPDDGRPLSHPALEGAPTFTEIADSVSSRLEDVIVAGFNVAFDVRFLEAELERSQRRPPDLVVLDVRELARLVLGAEGSMVAICNDFDVPLVGTHTALGDAETAAGLLTYLLDLADEVGVDAVKRLRVPAVPAGPRALRGSDRVVPRDPTVWPGREHREPVPGLRTTISFDDTAVAEHARRRLRDLLDDPGVDERHREQLRELIASDDAALAAWVWSQPAAPRTPTEEAVSRWRDLPGGLVGRHLRRQLLPELEGSEEHLRALGDLVWDEIEHGGIDEALAAILRYVDARGGINRDAETLEDDPVRMARKLIERVLDEANREGLDLILASVPWVDRCVAPDFGSLGDWFASMAYSWFARPDHDAAITLATLAITLAGSVDERWRRRAIEAHLIERAGRVAEAQALHEAAWSEGSRDWLAADRLSLILMRAGDPLGAAAVLEQALAHPPDEQRWSVVKVETLRKRLARCH